MAKPRLKNKIAIITGGATGIGEAISHKFALEGASVIVCGLPDDPVREVVDAINERGGKAIRFSGDMATDSTVPKDKLDLENKYEGLTDKPLTADV